MILSTAETRFDFDAPRVSSDGSAVMTVRCYVGDALWGTREIAMTRAQVDGVIDKPVNAGLSRREDVYVAFGEWLIGEGIIDGKFEMPAEPTPAPSPISVPEPTPVDPPMPAPTPVEEVPVQEAPYEVPVVQGEPEVKPEAAVEAKG